MIELRWSAMKESKPHEYLLRFFFGGACTMIAGMVAHRYGPMVGGIFLAFPAIFPAGATLIEAHEREKKQKIGSDGKRRGRMAAGSDAAGAALGCVALALFGLVLWKALPALNSALTSLLACLVWAISAPVLWELRKRRFFMRQSSS